MHLGLSLRPAMILEHEDEKFAGIMACFGDQTGTLSQYQAIALELAYAKTLMKIAEYANYEHWRQTVERSEFFKKPDWKEIIALTFERFKEMTEDLHKNAQEAKFLVTTKGEMFKMQANGTISRTGEEVVVHRKTCGGRKRLLK